MEVLFTQPNVELNQQVRLLTMGNAFNTPTSFLSDTVQLVLVYSSLVEHYKHTGCCCMTVFCVVGTGI